MPNWKKVIVSGSDATLNSLYAANSVTASIFSGSFTGSLEGTASWANNVISASYALTASFALNGGGGGGGGGAVTYHQTASAVTWSVNHSLNTYTPIVQVYDEDYNQLVPASVSGSSVNAVQITFSTATAGYAVITTGGLTITGSNAFLFQSTPATTWSFYHGLNETYPVFTIFDSNDDVIVPLKIHADNANTASIYFSTARTGTAVAANCGLSGSTFESASYSDYAVSASFASNAANATTASFITTAQTASFVTLAQTASYVLNAVSASYATSTLSASFALRGNGTFSGSFSGSFSGNGAGLTNIPASGVVGLNLSQITSGSVTASVDPAYGFKVNANTTISGSTQITGSLGVTGSVSITGSGTVLSANIDTISFTGSFAQSGSVTVVGNVNATSFTGSLLGTASFAVSASYAITSSFAQNAQTASYVLNAVSASHAAQAISSSYALTASYADNIVVSGSISNVDYIDFDTSVGYTLAEGRLGWDNGEGTLQLGLEGGNVTYSVGNQLYQYVYNAEATTMTKGQVVFVSGSQGNKIAVKYANDTGDPTSAGTLGLVAETIAAGGNGWVITEGPLRNLNTLGLTAGALLFLGSTPGTYTQTVPTAPSHSVRLGYVERVHASVGSIYVKIDNGYEIGELHDVVDSTTSSSYGDLFVKSGSVWINSRQLTGSYGLTGSLSATSLTGSLQVTGNSTYSGSQTVTTGYVVLTQVSQSLNYVDDADAASNGVPLGGLYRNGNFIAIRIV